MNSDMPNRAGPHLVSGHPPSAPGARAPLQHRVAIVTGGTGALGQAVTLRFLTDGAVVAVPYAVPAERDRLYQRVAAADRDRVVMEPVDVADLAAMTAFAASIAARRGKIDALVAGVGR